MSLRIKGLRKQFGSVIAVSDLDLDVVAGAFVSLVGPSGCGKTTTLRMISGFETPDSGTIHVNGQLINDVSVKKRNMGIVFQNYALFPNLTVEENIAFGLKARKRERKDIHKKVEEMLVLIGLPEIKKRLPAELSGGQQQRVALARALAIEPSMLLLDEPLSALDAKVRMNLRFEIKRIQRELNITTIYVTHDQEEALSISDQVVVMNKGKVQQTASPDEIYNTPANAFVADFIGISSRVDAEILNADEGEVRLLDKIFVLEKSLSFKDQERVAAILRPEDIRLGEQNEEDLSGVIEGVTFLGSIARFKVKIGEETLLADRPKGEQGSFSVGEYVSVDFNLDNLILL